MTGLTSRLAGPVVATLLVHCGLLAVYLYKEAWDITALVCAGRNRVGQAPYEAVTHPMGPAGHDGQFCYALARTPWSVHGGWIDNPPARQIRILYPALCWLLCGGHAQALFYVMPAVNLLAIAALAGLGGMMALRQGLSAWWGFFLPLACNLGLSLTHNFTDCLAALGAFGLVTACLLGWRGWVVGLWALIAVLAREQNVLLIGMVILVGLWLSRRDMVAWGGVAAAVWLAWVGTLALAYGRSPFLSAPGIFDWPLAGMAYRWEHLGGDVTFSRRQFIINGLSLYHLVVMVGVSLAILWRRCNPAIGLVLALGVTLALLAGSPIYEYWSYTRVFVWLPIGIFLYALLERQLWAMAVLAPGGAWTLLAVIRYV